MLAREEFACYTSDSGEWHMPGACHTLQDDIWQPIGGAYEL